MVLQNKYKRAVSARYKQASGSAAASASRSPSPSPAPSSYKLDPTFPTSSPPLPALSQDDPAGPSFRRRKVDSNAGRYANSSPSDSSDVDEEEKAEQGEVCADELGWTAKLNLCAAVRTRDLRAAELAAFSVKQRLALNVLSPPVSLDTSDVDTTFSHLLYHSLQPRYLRSRTPPTVENVEQARSTGLRVEATKAEAARGESLQDCPTTAAWSNYTSSAMRSRFETAAQELAVGQPAPLDLDGLFAEFAVAESDATPITGAAAQMSGGRSMFDQGGVRRCGKAHSQQFLDEVLGTE